MRHNLGQIVNAIVNILIKPSFMVAPELFRPVILDDAISLRFNLMKEPYRGGSGKDSWISSKWGSYFAKVVVDLYFKLAIRQFLDGRIKPHFSITHLLITDKSTNQGFRVVYTIVCL